MNEQNNTTDQKAAQNKIVRVVRVEISVSRLNALRFLPSAVLPEVAALLEAADEIVLRLKINGSIKDALQIQADG